MNPYIYPTRCSVCGGEGMLHACDLGADWLGAVQRDDPQMCRDNLKRERKRREKLRRELAQPEHAGK